MSNFANKKVDIKKVNKSRIFKLIYEEGCISKPLIASRLEISLPTAIQNVKALQEEGLVEEGGVLDSTGGRKAVALSAVSMARTAVGVDITRNHISVLLTDLNGKIIAQKGVKAPFRNDIEYARLLHEAVVQVVAQSGADAGSILGVGISVPGIPSADGQMLIHSHVLQVYNILLSDICRFISYPCILCNDANAAGIAEKWGRAEGKDFIYLSLSNTVGGAIMMKKELCQGDNQRGGEIGHMTLKQNGRKCYCGKQGCMDAYCSAQVLSDYCDGGLSEFFKRLKHGDKTLEKAWTKYLQYLVIAINNLRMIFDYDVILGGYVGAYMEDYIEDIRLMAAARNTFDLDGSYIKVCRYQKETAAVGAALLFIRGFLEKI